MSVISWESYSEIMFQLRNLYPKSTQNTDTVFSINFLNPV